MLDSKRIVEVVVEDVELAFAVEVVELAWTPAVARFVGVL